jgi:hypothetical protein
LKKEFERTLAYSNEFDYGPAELLLRPAKEKRLGINKSALLHCIKGKSSAKAAKSQFTAN